MEGRVAIRYIGSKARVAKAIMAEIGVPRSSDGIFVDAFAGTGAVACEAVANGWRVRLNDHLVSAGVLAGARVTSAGSATFSKLGGYEAVLERLNSIDPVRGFIWRSYTPASVASGAVERRYFTEDNGKRIDAIRAEIGRMHDSGETNTAENRVLLADLLEAANHVANTAGTYGCYLSDWIPSARRALHLHPRSLLEAKQELEVLNLDVTRVPIGPSDVVYYDPPYTKRQYAAYYHVLETIALGDEPEIGGKTGLRAWRHKASDFCYKSRALHAIVSLVIEAQARRVYLSYSSDGHVAMDQLVDALAREGRISVVPLGAIGRYRPNAEASNTADHVVEYLISFEKRDSSRLA